MEILPHQIAQLSLDPMTQYLDNFGGSDFVFSLICPSRNLFPIGQANFYSENTHPRIP